MRWMALWAVACGGNPVDDCKYFPESDCCRLSGQCFDFYGSSFPYCNEPDSDKGGTCSECLSDDDCPFLGQECESMGDNQKGCF